MKSEIYQTDVLIIGSGGAGCRAAIEVAKNGYKPVIVSKGLSFRSGCTGMAEGGYNAAIGAVNPEDNKKIHFKDTLKGGSYLNDKQLVKTLVDESPDRLKDLEEYGALFDRQENGKLNQRPFGGQTFKRTIYESDRTGHEIITSLKEEIIKRNIETLDEIMITSLILSKKNPNFPKVIGAVGIKLKDSSTIFFQTKSVIIACGGAGQLYPVTSNTIQKNGDGYVLAFNAGAEVIDMEEVQFHPTGMIYPKSKAGVLVTEAVRGEGGILLNKNNERFMENYDPRKELATRDVVARSIYNEIREGRGTKRNGVYLDISHLPDEVIDKKLKTMVEQFEDVGVNIKKEKMEVAPTAHHFMGGVKINDKCETNIKNLFAAGEASGGVHGANRLGGNALAETQVFGARSGISASECCENTEFEINKEMIENEESRINGLIKKGKYDPLKLKNALKNIMWEDVSIIRNEKGLNRALKNILKIKEETEDLNISNDSQYNKKLIDGLELINMVDVAILVVKSAIIRQESRGAHFREDFPETTDEWKKSIVMSQYNIKFIPR
ncbi:fumarate reductase (CoM/CoB) subunit TfrA [Methanobrevibacter sp. UBA412]|uniref:fumarate reductase (CoM/CoB) subunit TfrA n=1 Tax=Methanobrevibacter sp. UBA412 TaxID=1915486 RepID=UPI0039B92641